MARNGGMHLVISFFDDPPAAEVAARSLASGSGSRGGGEVVGMLTVDRDGEVRLVTTGPESSSADPGLGAVLGRIALAISGGVMPRRGRFFDARSDLSIDDVARFGAEIEAGGAAVAVLAERDRAERVVVQLVELGGKAETHHLTRRALRQAASSPSITDPPDP